MSRMFLQGPYLSVKAARVAASFADEGAVVQVTSTGFTVFLSDLAPLFFFIFYIILLVITMLTNSSVTADCFPSW